MTVDVEIREAPNAARDLSASQEQTSVTDRVRGIWPIFLVSLALVATLAWVALLGWLLYRAASFLLA